MLRPLFFVFAGVLLAFQDRIAALRNVTSSLLLVVLGVGAAIGASERVSMLAIGFGALGVFLSSLVMQDSAALAGAILVFGLTLERALRSRTTRERMIHFGLAWTVGAVAGAIASEFRLHTIATRIVVAIVAATLAGFPLFLRVRDHVAEALARGKTKLGAPLSERLGKLLELYEIGQEMERDEELGRVTQEALSKLRDLVDQRLDLERVTEGRSGASTAHATRLEGEITRYVGLLERAYAAPESGEAKVEEDHSSVVATPSEESRAQSL